VNSYLIVKTSALGDIVQSFAAAEYLAEKGAVDWVAEEPFCAMLRAHPAIRRVIPIQTRKWRKNPFSSELQETIRHLRAEEYDVLFDLQGNCKSGVFTLCAKARQKVGFSLETLPEWPNALVTRYRYHVDPALPIGMGYLRLVQNHFCDDEPFERKQQLLATPEEMYLDLSSPRYMVCFGSNWENKRLTVETLSAFLSEIEGSLLFVYGSGTERMIAEKYKRTFPGRSEVMGGLSVPEWQSLMRLTDGVISVDSSGLHLAAAAGVPTFSIFGPTKGSVYSPPSDGHKFFQGSCPYNKEFVKRCPILRTCESGACIREINPLELVHAFRGWEEDLRTLSKRQSQCGSAPDGSLL
jgi:heptosyltransferase I